jgi:glycosyltransferase involved in cell wall biosynthesis
MQSDLRVLQITSEWPTPKHPDWAPFIVQEIRELQKQGIYIKVFPFRGKKNPINYLKYWIDLRYTIDLRKFDLIHAQFGQSGLISLPSPIPVVVTFRGSDLQGWIGKNGSFTKTGKLMGHISRQIASWADGVILVSEHLSKYIEKNVRYEVIPSGVDLDLFIPEPQKAARIHLNLPSEKRYVLFAANPENPIKRYSLAKKACDQLKNRFNLELIVLSGFPQKFVPVYMNACDALILTSKHEGCPNVVKEALACNLPVVSLDVGDVKEFINKVPGCQLCADDKPETIAAQLAQVLEDPQRVQGRQAVEHLDWENTTKRIISVYREALRNQSNC